jgi:hypothetical protein
MLPASLLKAVASKKLLYIYTNLRKKIFAHFSVFGHKLSLAISSGHYRSFVGKMPETVNLKRPNRNNV